MPSRNISLRQSICIIALSLVFTLYRLLPALYNRYIPSSTSNLIMASQAHSHGHGHGHGSAEGGHDSWGGQAFLDHPSLKKMAVVSHESVVYTLKSAGVTQDEMKKMNLLEVGCGSGAVTNHYANTFATVHSIDTSTPALSYFSKLVSFPNVTHALHALTPSSPTEFSSSPPTLMVSPTEAEPERKLAPPRAKYDVAIANMVIHHVDDMAGFMQGLVGLLSPGGWVVFTEFGKKEGLTDKAKPMEGGSGNAPGHHHGAFTVESLTELLEKHGLVDVKAESRGTLPVFGPGVPDPLPPSDEPPCLIVRGHKA